MTTGKKNTNKRLRRTTLALMAASSLFIVLCGCRATTEFSPNNFDTGSAGVLIDELPVVDSGPHWATELPRIDLHDARYTGDCESPPVPTCNAQSFGIDDISITADCSSDQKFVVSGSMMEYDNTQSIRHGLPRDEYVHDGGDRGDTAHVRRDWQVDGLELEDTVAHFDTLSGEIQVVASNHTAIYSPRFAATRQIQLVQQSRVNTQPTGSTMIDHVAEHDHREKFGAIKQPMATVRAVGASIGTVLEEHQRGITVDDVDIPIDWQVNLLPYENFDIIARGVLEVDQQESVLHFANAAHAWSAVESAQATVLGMVPSQSKHIAQASAEVVYEMPDGKARLRLVKLASESSAHSGDTVSFTLRFDNVGDEAIGNVTIIDNLTMRLEYIKDSEECSMDASFAADDSQSESLALRWEIAEPLEPGEGGVIRFQCRVR